ncbi:MAG: hypothetical protein Q9223_000622 [Gallowayella weberi]
MAMQYSVEASGSPNSSSRGTTPAKTSLEKVDNGQLRFRGCSSIKSYDISEKLGEGTFGEVYKARSFKDGHIVALKKILMHNEKDGFPITALREIKLLKMLSHPNILRLEEMAVERTKGEGRKKAIMYMVTPYMDHDLSGLLENPNVQFSEPQIKCYMLQLLEGLRYLHASKILHRDMKAANLLINNRGILQIADFGLARPYDDPPPQPGQGGGEAKRDYTTLVVTRWYRPPELLLQLRRYTTAIDMWGVGCVFGEMFRGKPILAGTSDLNQAQIIFDLVGSPTEDNMPGWSSLPGCEGVKSFTPRSSTLAQAFRQEGSSAISLLSDLLKLDWRKRINAIDALQHPYFKNPPLPARPGDIPQFEESHELDRRRFRGQKAALPPAPAGGSVGMGPHGDWTNGSMVATHQAPPRPRGGNTGNNSLRDETIITTACITRHRIIEFQDHQHRHRHLYIDRLGPGMATAFLRGLHQVMLGALEALAGQTNYQPTALECECRQGACQLLVPRAGKLTRTFQLMRAVTMDCAGGMTGNEETTGAIGGDTVTDETVNFGIQRVDGLAAPSRIVNGTATARCIDGDSTDEGEDDIHNITNTVIDQLGAGSYLAGTEHFTDQLATPVSTTYVIDPSALNAAGSRR